MPNLDAIQVRISGYGSFNNMAECYARAISDCQAHVKKTFPRLMRRTKRDTPKDTGLLKSSYIGAVKAEGASPGDDVFLRMHIKNHTWYGGFQEVAPYRRHFAEKAMLKYVLRGFN